ncbi:hypothetical protein BKA70DRAFT_1431115 [Coprinopsis sp. MPI-PUGE-AT-0042]|nr:hypothetical protein BKA70DRAFT_1431115 [Coprinopsis sp. MPI-PUGE-AT-0042]
MHRCLDTPEILLNVLEALYFNKAVEWVPGNPAPLAALARTCQDFYLPVIRVLWSDLPGLSAISYLMPESTYILHGGSVHLSAGLSTGFLERLELHAPLVKSLRYRRKGDPRRLHATVLLALSSSPATSYPLFPNLKRVQLPCNVDGPMEAMFYPAVVLGSPSLTEITVFTNDRAQLDDAGHWRTKSDEAQWEAFTNRLVPSAPRLERFLISNTGKLVAERQLDTPHLARLCTVFSKPMTHLNVSSIQLPRTAIMNFGSLSQLAKLSISVNDHNFGGLTASNNLVVFHRLTPLTVAMTSLTSGNTFFSTIDPARLQQLIADLHLGSSAPAELDICPLVNSLSHWTCSATLSKIFIGRTLAGASTSNLQVTDATLVPLAAFQSLREITISPAINHLSDKGLLAAFSSWTQLEYFLLHQVANVNVQEGLNLTLTGVYKALQYSPSLTRLGLECDCQEIPPLEDLALPHQLHTWRVSCSPIANGPGFAEWARVCFPGLRKLEYFMNLRNLVNRDFNEAWRTSRRSLIYLDQWNDVPKILGLKK